MVETLPAAMQKSNRFSVDADKGIRSATHYDLYGENQRAVFSIDLSGLFPPTNGHYLLGFHTLEGGGSLVELEISVLDPATGEKRVVVSPPTLWDMQARDNRDSFFTSIPWNSGIME